MTTYTPPLEDVGFVLDKLCNISRLADLPGFEDVSPDLVSAVTEEAGKLAEKVLAPLNTVGDKDGAKLTENGVVAPPGFAEAYRQYIQGGWLGLSQPTQYGGQGMPFLLHMAVSEFWTSANMSFSLCPMLAVGAIDAFKAHASEEIKEKFMARLVAGEWAGTMNLTEPQAGSDLSAVTTKAVPQDDHYLISGTKIFITWGDHDMAENILHLVLARLPDAPEGVKGISLFLVPKFLVNDDGSLGERNDLKCISLEHKLGIHGSPTCVMSFGDEKGAVGYLIGEKNNGLACMFTMMNHARLEVGLEGTAMSERAYQAAVEYAKERKQGTKKGHQGRVSIIEHPDVRRMLMVMRALTQASRALGCVAANAMDQAHNNPDRDLQSKYRARLDLLTPVVKAWSTEIAQEVTSLAIQVYGGMGYVEESGVAQYYRDVRITTIYEGTSGIQANDLIGRKLIRDGGQAMNDLMGEIKELASGMKSAGDETLAGLAKQLEEAIAVQEETSNYILENCQSHDDAPQSAAFNYLMLTGTVAGAWMMARSAQAAQAMLDQGEGSAAFARAKIATARFYMTHILPRALGYRDAVKAGHEVVMAISSDNF